MVNAAFTTTLPTNIKSHKYTDEIGHFHFHNLTQRQNLRTKSLKHQSEPPVYLYVHRAFHDLTTSYIVMYVQYLKEESIKLVSFSLE